MNKMPDTISRKDHIQIVVIAILIWVSVFLVAVTYIVAWETNRVARLMRELNAIHLNECEQVGMRMLTAPQVIFTTGTLSRKLQEVIDHEPKILQ